MPDILIRGVELPKYGCAGCYFKTGKYCGIIEKNENVEEYSLRAERHPNCPLIELPPHVDLIDRDALVEEQKLSRDYHAQNSREESLLERAIRIVREAPAIVPAEREGEA